MQNGSAITHLSVLRSSSLKFTLVGLAYFFTAKLGLMGPYKESIATLLWLPTGIAVGAIMRWGKVSLPAVFIAATFVEYSLGLPISTSLGIACGNTFAPFLVAYLLKKLQFDHHLIRQRDILLMVAMAFLGMLIS